VAVSVALHTTPTSMGRYEHCYVADLRVNDTIIYVRR
jgi:hypothetical protein